MRVVEGDDAGGGLVQCVEDLRLEDKDRYDGHENWDYPRSLFHEVGDARGGAFIDDQDTAAGG